MEYPHPKSRIVPKQPSRFLDLPPSLVRYKLRTHGCLWNSLEILGPSLSCGLLTKSSKTTSGTVQFPNLELKLMERKANEAKNPRSQHRPSSLTLRALSCQQEFSSLMMEQHSSKLTSQMCKKMLEGLRSDHTKTSNPFWQKENPFPLKVFQCWLLDSFLRLHHLDFRQTPCVFLRSTEAQMSQSFSMWSQCNWVIRQFIDSQIRKHQNWPFFQPGFFVCMFSRTCGLCHMIGTIWLHTRFVLWFSSSLSSSCVVTQIVIRSAGLSIRQLRNLGLNQGSSMSGLFAGQRMMDPSQVLSMLMSCRFTSVSQSHRLRTCTVHPEGKEFSLSHDAKIRLGQTPLLLLSGCHNPVCKTSCTKSRQLTIA